MNKSIMGKFHHVFESSKITLGGGRGYRDDSGWGAGVMEWSAKEEVLLPGGHGLMVRGYLPVINTLAKGLDIRLGHSVLIAKRISFEPRLPDWKEAAIDELWVGFENKIILHFDNVFWPNVEFLGVVADTSYGCSYFLNLRKVARHPVLVYMPSGRLAKDIEKMSDEAAANFAFIQYINSLGSYSYDQVGKPHELYERLRVQVDNLFFAGEATSMSYTGSVHGAYSTGTMAAEDCRMRVLE
ncbi:hypothetical protein TSUD_132190 [Trifolium subterraneum]|uniref:Amine oxidase domain-containing protein n=1 Tax=Trifolium subterraneum TaxID=3900 RepID=A0A2Z6LV43_TRISU|nr:hypothetical protein TSUD_132190 [Trifolium subterraneum]